MPTAENWNATYESIPNADTIADQIPSNIGSLKYNIRRINNKEHYHEVPSNEADPGDVYVQQGLHRAGSAVAFVSDDAPTTRPDGTALDDETSGEDNPDRGRVWVSTAGRRRVIYYWDTDDPDDIGWKQLSVGDTGQIAFFPKITPQAGWVLCNGTQITVASNPEYEALIHYLTEDDGAISAMLPRMTDSSGRYIKAVGTTALGEENWGSGVTQQTPKLGYGTPGYHRHVIETPVLSVAGEDVAIVKEGSWDYSNFHVDTVTDEDGFKGTHVHWTRGADGTGGIEMAAASTVQSGTTQDDGLHQHRTEITPFTHLGHSHMMAVMKAPDWDVKTEGWVYTNVGDYKSIAEGTLPEPNHICLYPFIHI